MLVVHSTRPARPSRRTTSRHTKLPVQLTLRFSDPRDPAADERMKRPVVNLPWIRDNFRWTEPAISSLAARRDQPRKLIRWFPPRWNFPYRLRTREALLLFFLLLFLRWQALSSADWGKERTNGASDADVVFWAIAAYRTFVIKRIIPSSSREQGPILHRRLDSFVSYERYRKTLRGESDIETRRRVVAERVKSAVPISESEHPNRPWRFTQPRV